MSEPDSLDISAEQRRIRTDGVIDMLLSVERHSCN
jgi:hypothetical protein